MIVTFLNGDKYNTSKVEFKLTSCNNPLTICFNINDNVNDNVNDSVLLFVVSYVKSIEESGVNNTVIDDAEYLQWKSGQIGK